MHGKCDVLHFFKNIYDDFMSSQLSQGRSDEYLGNYDTDIIDSDDEMDFFEGWLLDGE
jgi:hypothetical protein